MLHSKTTQFSTFTKLNKADTFHSYPHSWLNEDDHNFKLIFVPVFASPRHITAKEHVKICCSKRGLGVTVHPQRQPHWEKQFAGAFSPYFQCPSLDHRITECLEGTFKDHLIPTASHGQGHCPLDQAAQKFIQP